MVSPMFLLLIVLLYSTASGKHNFKPMPKCTEIMSAFGASNDVNELISLVRNWKMELEKIPSLDAVKRDAIAENLNECQKMSSNLLVQFMVEDMHGQLKCTENAATVSEQMTKRHEMIANMTSKMESCKTKVAEMKDQNANVSKKMEQTHGQIVELNEIVKQLKMEQQQMRNNSEQAILKLAMELDEEQQKHKKLAKQFETEKHQRTKCHDEKTGLEMAKGNWKIATFVLIGGVAILILAISVALLLLLFTGRFKALTTPHI